MRLLVMQTCPCCKGSKQQEHPDWTAFLDEFKAQKKKLIDLENGYPEAWFMKKGYLIPPARTIPCQLCKATGLVLGYISLKDLIDLVKTTQRKSPCLLH